MNDLNFNIYTFTAPATRAEYIGLLDEALRLADELSEMVDAGTKLLGNRSSARRVNSES